MNYKDNYKDINEQLNNFKNVKVFKHRQLFNKM